MFFVKIMNNFSLKICAGWTLDANSRPSFVELAEVFAKMARDPGRYLCIQVSIINKEAFSFQRDVITLSFLHNLAKRVFSFSPFPPIQRPNFRPLQQTTFFTIFSTLLNH